MGIELRLPNITGVTEEEQLRQIKSYLYQIIPELQYAFEAVGSAPVASEETQTVVNQPYPGYSSSTETSSAKVTFAEMKSLIIKSADIINAYYYEISKKLEGVYVAQSVFGEFAEKTSQAIEETSASTTQRFENTQAIITSQYGRIAELDADLQNSKTAINESVQSVQDNLTGVNALIEDTKAQLHGSIEDITVYLSELENVIIGVSAYLKSGLLYYDGGVPVYGLEIGQENTIDGEKVFNKFARFTSDRLSFYDQNDTEVAYVSDHKLYIRNVEITESFREGGYKDFIDTNGGIVTKWVGGR